jgi:hypothetical protein
MSRRTISRSAIDADRWQPLDRPSNIPFAAAWLKAGPGQELHLVEAPDFEPSAFEREYGRHIAVSYPRETTALAL